MKTASEWSIEFDLMYNNIASDKAPGLTEYEKSVFLTRAQESIVTGMYNGTFGESFESSEALTQYLSVLVAQSSECPELDSDEVEAFGPICSDSQIFQLPGDLLFITSEFCETADSCKGKLPATVVVPVTQDEFWRTFRDPFKGPNKRRVLRLLRSTVSPKKDDPETPTPVPVNYKYAELVPASKVTAYSVRYLRRPKPIILPGVEETINGYIVSGNGGMTCELDEALHSTILSEAVRQAKAIWNS